MWSYPRGEAERSAGLSTTDNQAFPQDDELHSEPEHLDADKFAVKVSDANFEWEKAVAEVSTAGESIKDAAGGANANAAAASPAKAAAPVPAIAEAKEQEAGTGTRIVAAVSRHKFETSFMILSLDLSISV